jgi:hypothetical protein
LLKRFIFTEHALRRMKERGVRRSEVYETLFSPDLPYQQGQLDEEIAIKRIGHREIRVVFEVKKTGECIIYTVIVKPLRKKR